MRAAGRIAAPHPDLDFFPEVDQHAADLTFVELDTDELKHPLYGRCRSPRGCSPGLDLDRSPVGHFRAYFFLPFC
jgi:hypothetical protein